MHVYDSNSFVNRLFKGRKRKDFIKFGLSAKELVDAGANPKLMLASGFEVRELRDSGVSILELIRAGVEPTDFRKAKIGVGELMEGMEGHRVMSLRELADCYGIDAIRKECRMSDLRELSGSMSSLKYSQPRRSPAGMTSDPC